MTGSQKTEVLFNEPLAPWTSFRIGGPAEVLFLPKDVDGVGRVLDGIRQKEAPVTVIGGGSNVLISDQGIRGPVVILGKHLNRVNLYLEDETATVRAWAGAGLAQLTALAAKEGLADLVFLAGIPGTAGGATVMNAGTGAESMDRVVTGLIIMESSGNVRRLERDELGFGYRSSKLTPEAIILEVELTSRLAPAAQVAGEIKAALAARRTKQPAGLSSAGSFFKNPGDDFAGRLIQEAGLKGERVGQAQVSEVHANWIVNLGGATAEEVMTLAQRVRTRVEEKFEVSLEPEVRFLGEGEERWPWMRF
ncbi:MAG: UDP-N-acetylmuramate dehydrogenase [Chlorobiales bacterium]|nr:UDP-N-acetylmuramate dehydrogenase [Chlorobiales bacterium]